MSTHQKRKPRGYCEAEQFEMPIDGGFALIVEDAVDGERITREREAQEAAERALREHPELF